MTIVLNHTIVPVGDRHRGARLLAGLLGVEAGDPAGPFAPVRVNADLTLDFDDRLGARPGHYAFLVDDDTFDAALAHAQRSGLEWGSAPRLIDRQINHLGGGRGVYILDPDGIAYEFFTSVP
ncbi:VOC family protein [Dactylosporangium sp. NBC_01737]|uniref:VOC family protein n=1 Tax=Dactylosporangium sp. NBC_01737 TaxID=2975959 RepID=UPI002E153EFB|nr:VOC family protein [Dactylosporangium sp. NBC_01737]